MKNKPPYKMQFLFRLHNAFLSSGSLLLVLLILEEVLPKVYQHGWFYGFCNEQMWSDVSYACHFACLDAYSLFRRDWNSTT